VHMGAHDAALSFEEAEVISETRGRANRNTNWDEANLARMSEASRAQRHAIEMLELDELAPPLQQVARLRLRHADLSLTELGRRASPPLTKAAVARRMRTLMTLAES
jgi:cell division protein WhiA